MNFERGNRFTQIWETRCVQLKNKVHFLICGISQFLPHLCSLPGQWLLQNSLPASCVEASARCPKACFSSAECLLCLNSKSRVPTVKVG